MEEMEENQDKKKRDAKQQQNNNNNNNNNGSNKATTTTTATTSKQQKPLPPPLSTTTGEDMEENQDKKKRDAKQQQNNNNGSNKATTITATTSRQQKPLPPPLSTTTREEMGKNQDEKKRDAKQQNNNNNNNNNNGSNKATTTTTTATTSKQQKPPLPPPLSKTTREEMEENQDKKKRDAKTDSGTDDGFDIEPILQALGHGGVGRYQCLQMVLQLSCLFSVACSVMSVVFFGYKPPYQCASVNTSKLEALVGWSANSTGNMTVSYGQCSIMVQVNDSGQLATSSLPCVEGYEYEGNKDASFFTEWDLTCEKSALTELTQTLMMAGQALGGVVFTALADFFGRKPVYASCSFIMLIFSVATALSPNYIFFIICRVLTGAIQQGSGLVGFTMFIELLPKRLRGAAGVFDGGLWSFSLMFLPALAYLMRNYSWRHLQFLLAASSLFSLSLPWCLDESLRWLVANKKTARAERILKKASRLNRVPYQQVHQALHAILQDQPIKKTNTLELANDHEPKDEVKDNKISKKTLPVESVCIHNDSTNGDMELREPSNRNSELRESANGKADSKEPANGNTDVSGPINGGVSVTSTAEKCGDVQKYTVVDIFKSKCLLKVLAIVSYLWITNNVTYYGLMLTSASLAGNRYLNFFLQALMEFPAYLSAYFLLKRFGRRNVTCGFLCLTALCLLLSSVITATVKSSVVGPITNVFSLLGKYAISGSFSIIFVYCPELFPTNLRTAGLGIASGVARLIGTVAPFTNNLAAVVLWAPGILFGGMALLAALLVMKLPETRGRPMPTTIEDMKLWYGN